MKKRLSEVEESCREFKNLYRNLCLRDDVLMLTSNLKAEMAMYVDMAQKQWEFEYRKDHSEAMDRFENVLHMTKNITPRIEFNVSTTHMMTLIHNTIPFVCTCSDNYRSRVSCQKQSRELKMSY